MIVSTFHSIRTRRRSAPASVGHSNVERRARARDEAVLGLLLLYHLIFENRDASMTRQGDAPVGLIERELGNRH